MHADDLRPGRGGGARRAPRRRELVAQSARSRAHSRRRWQWHQDVVASRLTRPPWASCPPVLRCAARAVRAHVRGVPPLRKEVHVGAALVRGNHAPVQEASEIAGAHAGARTSRASLEQLTGLPCDTCALPGAGAGRTTRRGPRGTRGTPGTFGERLSRCASSCHRRRRCMAFMTWCHGAAAR